MPPLTQESTITNTHSLLNAGFADGTCNPESMERRLRKLLGINVRL